MKVLKTITAGQKGSQKYLQAWGNKLLNVRYREHDDGDTIVTTIEIVVDERPRLRKGSQQRGYLAARAKSIVGINIGDAEFGLRNKVKKWGGQWNNERKLWMLARDKVVALGLVDRVATKLTK